MKHRILTVFILCLGIQTIAKSNIHDNLFKALFGFEQPQDNTRTKVWWFHGENETTKYGITADLEALKKAGIGGVVYYDQVFGDQAWALPAMSEDWWEMLKFSALEAKRVGLSFEANVSNGYVAGGPWIKHENSMKRLVATELIVEGGKSLEVKLSTPESRYNYYKDVAVLAFPAPKDGGGISSLTTNAKFTASTTDLDAASFFNPSGAMVKIPFQPSGQSVYVNIEFPEQFTARSITYQVRPNGKATTSATNVPDKSGPVFVGTGYKVLPTLGQLEVSNDGKTYVKVCDLQPIYRAHESWQQKTISFSKVQGKYYRLNLHDWSHKDFPSKDLFLGNVLFSSDAHMDQWEEKAGLFSEYQDYEKTPEYKEDELIQPKKVINLSSNMDSKGVLRWNAPAGKWIIMRFAQVSTGATTKHGRNNLVGLECDKMSVKAAEIQFANYFKPILDTIRSVHASISGLAMDSHEAGAQNWTDNFLTEFETRRGYSLLPYLPVAWGRVVSSTKASAGVLYDMRRTIADLISDNYYGTFQKLCANEGVTFTAQATGNALCIVSDPIQAKSKVGIPQGEFWIGHPDGNYDIKESSSSAHLYGKNIASAEAYTGALYNHTLSDLKNIADGAYAFGINEFVVCASAYQPWDSTRMPGNVARGWEWIVNRNNTWWNFSKDFWDYQSRAAYLLRRGRPVVDLCVYLGDNAPVKILTYRLPDIPSGFYFDAFTQDALLTRMSASNGKVVLPDGLAYSMMVLPRSGEITLSALRKIAELVRNGAKVWGARPTGSPSKMDLGQEVAYSKLVKSLWSTGEKGAKAFGKGIVYWGMTLQEAISKEGIVPDIQVVNGSLKDDKMYFAHREMEDADIYFINNHKDTEQLSTFRFRTQRTQIQVWNPMTGKRYSAAMLTKTKNSVTAFLKFAPRESYFVVFSNKDEKLPQISFAQPIREQTLNTGWQANFSERWGGPGVVTIDKLADWTENSLPGIRYYSGTAVYTKEVKLEELPANEKVCLALKQRNSVSEVYVNGVKAGTIWCSPWETDVTNLLKKGTNKVEIRIANTWINRLIGDAGVPEENRVTWTNAPIAKPTDALQPAGLVEVKLVYVSVIE